MDTQNQLKKLTNVQFISPKLENSRLANAAHLLHLQIGIESVTEPQKSSVEAMVLKLKAINEGEGDFSQLNRKEHRVIPWAFFYYGNEHRLIDDDRLLNRCLDHLIETKNTSSLSHWIHIFLLFYPTELTGFTALQTKLLTILWSATDQKSLKLGKWVEDNQLLEPDADIEFAKLAIQRGVKETFDRYRLSASLMTGQFALSGLSRLLGMFSMIFSTYDDTQQNQILDSLFEQLVDGNDFRYQSLRTDLANGLLEPFSELSPSHEIKSRLKRFFNDYYGDIRIDKTRWQSVSDKAKTVMQKWMVENTLHDFFSLLTHVSRYDSTADRHWEYRKRFWNAYLRKGVISEAWVALGPTAYYEAKQFIKEGSNVYAALSGAQSRHSALIMIIDGVLITEWSHSGRYRVWQSKSERPQLYKKSYHRNELVTGFSHEGNHSASEAGGWQSTLSDIIRQLTGVHVTSREYMAR